MSVIGTSSSSSTEARLVQPEARLALSDSTTILGLAGTEEDEASRNVSGASLHVEKEKK